jgi:hypothetical protein
VAILVEAAGWAGALLILVGYAFLSMNKLSGQSIAYQAMNVVGAAGFIGNGWYHGAMPSAVLNIVWMLIGVVALWRLFKRKGSSTSAM